MINKRIESLDLIRLIAIFSVIAGHFFVLNTPFRKTDFIMPDMFWQVFFTSI